MRLLRVLALHMIDKTTSNEYNKAMDDPPGGRQIVSHVASRWIKSLMQLKQIILRSKAGKLSSCPVKQEMVEQEIAFHLRKLSREFGDGTLTEECVFNSNETYLVIDNNYGRTLAMGGDESVVFADVVSGDEGMTMMFMPGGCPRSHLRVSINLFQSKTCSYSIRGWSDDVPGACYGTGPKEWMDRKVFLEWLKEKHFFRRLPGGKKRVLFVENATGQKLTEDVLAALSWSNKEI